MVGSAAARRVVLTVAASFLLTFTACGLNFAFGVYQELYETLGGPFASASPAQIDLIGTLSISLMTIGAPFASAWCRVYSPRTVSLLGGLIFGLANILASYGQRLWHFILAQGILLGVGTCLTYMPAVTVTPGWLGANRGLGMGVVLSGTGVGGVVWAPALRALNNRIGFRDTLRLTGALSFGMIALSSLMLTWDPDTDRRVRAEMQGTRSRSRLGSVPLVNWQVAKSRKFLAQALGGMLQSAAYYTPVYFFSSYARTLGYSAAAGANFIALSNGSSAAGKVVIGFAADRIGRLNALLICTLISALTALGLWLPSTLSEGQGAGKPLFVAFAMLYGIFAGAYVSLFPTSLVELFGVQHFTSVNGFLYMTRGLATMVGTPVAGALIRGSSSQHLSSAFEKTSIMVGVLLTGATVSVLWVRFEATSLGGYRWKV